MKLKKYVDRLPILPMLKPKGIFREFTHYEVRMNQFKQKLHRDLPETWLWGYNGIYPGPTFEVLRNERVRVHWINELPINHHILPVDTTVNGAEPYYSKVRTVVHLHGGSVPHYSDGYPDAWFTSGYRYVGPDFKTALYDYPNHQQPTMLWYHDHALGITRLNIYAGMAGVYIIRDPQERYLNLPSGRYEIPLLIQDKSFNEDGSLYYPVQPEDPAPVCPSVVPEFFADTIIVNGKVWPYLEVEPRKYRFRIVNASNSRFYRMKLSTGQSFYQIGSDQGYLESPVILQNVLITPGEHVDLIIDFSEFKKENIILQNDAAL